VAPEAFARFGQFFRRVLIDSQCRRRMSGEHERSRHKGFSHNIAAGQNQLHQYVIVY
jgi:hypothetical protein